ncbi:MAG: diacylglycerol kinase family protein [Myxococcota bacterium]|jgi:diacylglycerol kinase (ATP)
MGFSAKDRIRSFRHAGNGLRVLVSGQHNAWIHATLTGVAIGLGFALRISGLEWCAIVIVIALVWVAEGCNTALELLADAAVPERNEKIGQAKDTAAGAVLVAAIAAATVAAIVFLPRLLALAG